MDLPNRRFVLSMLLVVLAGCRGAVQGDTSPTLPSSPASPTTTAFPSPIPTTQAPIDSCPVSLPNVSKSPDEYYVSTINSYQNDDGTLFTPLWPGGKVIFSPRGPGRILSDGSLGMKWPWYRTIPGEVLIDGRRLDALAPPMPTVILKGVPDGYGETGFHAGGLLFPSEGCWEVTAKVGDASLTFVTLVVKVPFEPAWPKWLPEGVIEKDTDITALPKSLRYIYSSSIGDEGEISFETTQGLPDNPTSYPEAAQQLVTVNGQQGVCVQGVWDKQGQWQAEAEAGTLDWVADGFSYRISYTGLKLRCEDLLRMADSPP